MKLGDILDFRKDLYFEGAVQADWFYSPQKAAKVAENFVFHGAKYFGIDDIGGSKKRIDTISFVEEIENKLNDDRSNALSLVVADYGTGKSHLAVTLAQLFSGPAYMGATYSKIINNIAKIDKSEAEKIKELSSGRNFVMVLNGMRDFNLHSEILKAAQKSLKLYGMSDDCLRKINRAIETAENFFERNGKGLITHFENASEKRGWTEKGDLLLNKIDAELMTDDEAFDIVNDVYTEVNGQPISWDEGLSASSILETLISECCGMNGKFDHIIILFDEFGRYLEYTSGVNAAKSGESGLQQIFELTQKTQNVDGYLHVINFIQRDIKQYLETVDQTKNISRYIGRFDQSDKYYLSSNLETVFANLIHRKDEQAFNDIVINWQKDHEDRWIVLFNKMNKWLMTKGMWKDYKTFRKVVVEGIYPLHPLSTYMLTNLSDYLQNRSSLTLISNYIDMYSNTEVSMSDDPVLVMPEELIHGDLYTEMLSAEQEGRQKSQQCIKYDNILAKYQDKLSEKSLMVLRANLILRILRFRTSDYDDVIDALSICSGLSAQEVKGELKWLTDEYAVMEFDEHASVFDFTEESNGAHDFKIIKKRMMSDVKVDRNMWTTPKIRRLVGFEEVFNTNFGIKHNILTNEWNFIQEMYPIEDFTVEECNRYVDEWEKATSSTEPKGRIIWLYINKDTDASEIDRAKKLVNNFENKPIIVMILNDTDNRAIDCLTEYIVLDQMDISIREKYNRHFNEDYNKSENNLKDEIDGLKRQRIRLNDKGIDKLSHRMPIFLTEVLENIYPDAVPFHFDGFITKANNIAPKAGGYYCSFLKMFLTNSVSDVTIHNFGVEIRNRVEALFSTKVATSWKCINENYRLIEPEENNAKRVYNEIANSITKDHEVACKNIFNKYTKPPYGMSDEAITMMIAIVCATLSYCVRIRYNNLKNISLWKDDIISKDEKKVNHDVVMKSSLVYVDADAVSGKYMRIFAEIRNNNTVRKALELSGRLSSMLLVDDVPSELEPSYLLAKKTLDSAKKAKDEWDEKISEIDEKYDDALEDNNIYNTLVALELLNKLPIKTIFNDNGYDFDDEHKAQVRVYRDKLTNYVNENIKNYVDDMYCKSIAGMNTFRNHNRKIEEKLRGLGFIRYADAVRDRREKELSNVEEIKSRQEIKGDLEKYIDEKNFDKYTPYTTVCALLKEGQELMGRAQKYRDALESDSNALLNQLDERLHELIKIKDRVNEDITDIWDDLYDAKTSDDIEDIQERIFLVLQKGIKPSDQADLLELQESIAGLLNDISELNDTKDNRRDFEKTSIQKKDKYNESEMDFNAEGIIDQVIVEIAKEMDERENKWRTKHLSLGDKSRESIHKWKEATKYLPDFLSDSTIADYKDLDDEANSLIKDSKIDDVVFYFNMLDQGAKKECLKKLENML